MKVLFNSSLPFFLAHGGTQIQIEQTKAALEQIGVTVEMVRWWDDAQTGEIFHHFGRIPTHVLRLAQAKGMKVVFSELLTETGSRAPLRLKAQKLGNRVLGKLLPGSTVGTLGWESYRLADACLALTRWEAHLMIELFGARAERMHVVPNGVEEVFLKSPAQSRSQWLVCTAAITERKRVLELAQAAVAAQTPVWVIGAPYTETDPYGQRFVQLARQHPQLIRYEGGIRDRTQLARTYREARGFVLLSTMESLSLSALEAAACECPLLLSDLPWARWTFGEKASYCPVSPSTQVTAAALKDFYARAPQLAVAPRPLSWRQVGEQIKALYEALLKTSR